MKKWCWVFIMLVVILIPVIINWLIIQPALFKVAGDETTWLSFWVTYISAIASFAMVVITWFTLKHNKTQNELILNQNEEQLNELKRQWKEQNKPKIIPYISKDNGQGFLVIKNYSPAFVNEVKVQLEIVGDVKLDWMEKLKPKLDQALLNMEPFGSKFLLINHTCWAETVYNGALKVIISIEGKRHNEFILNLSEWNVIEYNNNDNKNIISAINDIKSELRNGVKIK